MSRDRALELEGDAGYPRRNGQPVFAAPWQSRAFGMAMALHERGTFGWEDFRRRLIAEIAETPDADQGHGRDPDGSLYYRCWLSALAAVLAERGLVTADELGRRSEEFRQGVRAEVH